MMNLPVKRNFDKSISSSIIKKLKNPLFKIKKYIFRQKYKAVF